MSLDPNNIMITTTPTTFYSDNLNLVASALLSAWAPTSKGVYQLNSPEIPSHRRSADELPVLQPKLILTYTYKRTQAGSPGIENNIELKWLAPGTQRFVHSRPQISTSTYQGSDFKIT